MKMKQLLILVGAVVVLWAIFVLLDRTSVPTAEDEYLVQADSAAIQELEIMNQQKGETITLTRRDDGWYITNPIDYPANEQYITQLLDKVGEMRIESEVTSNKDRWGEFEVDTSGVVLTVRADGDESRVVVGKAAESYRQSYARPADADNVYLVTGTYKMQLSRSLENWRDKQIFPHEQHNIVRVEAPEYTLIRDGENWTLLDAAGDTLNVDKTKAVQVQSQIARLRTSDFPDEEEYVDVNWDDPTSVVTVGLDNGGNLTMQFYLDPNNERRYFVRMGDNEHVYVIFEGIYNQIVKGTDKLVAEEPTEAMAG